MCRRGAGRRAPLRRLRDVIWGQPIVVGDVPVEVLVRLTVTPQGFAFRVVSRRDGTDIVHAQGRVTDRSPEGGGEETSVDLEAIRRRCGQGVDGAQVYQRFERFGVHYGPMFQVTETAYPGEREALVKLVLPAALATTAHEYSLHPAIMDGALRATYWCDQGRALENSSPHIPFALDDLEILGPLPATCYGYATKLPSTDETLRWNVLVLAEDGRVVVRASGFAGRPLRIASAARKSAPLLYYRPEWSPLPIAVGQKGSQETKARPVVVVFSDRVDEGLRRRAADTHDLVFVSRHRAFARAGDWEYRLDPAQPQHYKMLVRDLEQRGSIEGIIHLWAAGDERLDWPAANPADGVPGRELGDQMDRGLFSVLYLIQALPARRVRCVFGFPWGQPEHTAVAGLAAALTTVNHRFELVSAAVDASLGSEERAQPAVERVPGRRHA